MLLSGPSYLMQSESPNDLLEDHLWGTIRKFIRFQVLIAAPDEIDPVFDTGYSIFMLIGLILIGAGLISDDKRYKVLDIYDSKIDRKTYLTGKYGTLILFGNLLFTLPCIIEWGLLIIKWEELFERKASIQERLKQARLENYIVEAKRIQEAWVRPSADTFNQ